MEWRVAYRPYVPSTWWCPGDQSQSTDFSTGWASRAVYSCGVSSHENCYGGEPHIHSRAVVWYFDSCDLYGYHSRCTRQLRWHCQVQLHGQQWARSNPGQYQLQSRRDHQNVYFYLEWCVACRPYVSWTRWYPGDQPQSTDFSIGCANRGVQLT